MKHFLAISLTAILMLIIIVPAALAQDSLVPSPTPAPTVAPTVTPVPTDAPEPTLVPTAPAEPTPVPDLPADSEDIVSDIMALVDSAGLGSLVSLLVMVLTYFNVIPDGWGGKVYFFVGVFVFAVTLTLSVDDAEYVFSLLRELVSLISLLLGGIGTHAGLGYLEMLPGRR